MSNLATIVAIPARRLTIGGGGATNNTLTIQAEIDRLDTLGGGEIWLPEGIIDVDGDGTPSHGGLQLKSNITLRGQGVGVTTIRLAAAQVADVTGIIRTPSGEVTENVKIIDLTIDGNKDNQGVLTLESLVRVDADTARATLTAHGFAVDDEKYIIGATPSVYNKYLKITAETDDTFDFDLVSDPSTDATGTILLAHAHDGFYCGTSPGSSDEDRNISLIRVEIKNCTRYGSDPHEQTRNLLHRNVISHDNGLDGFVADYIEDGTWDGCESYDNDRHGYNCTTKSSNCKFISVEGYNNGSNGFVSQKGSTSGNEPKYIDLISSNFYGNQKENVVFRETLYASYIGGANYEAQREGFTIKGSQHIKVDLVSFRNNGQASNNSYADIKMLRESTSAATQNCFIGRGNTYKADAANKVQYHIEEVSESVGGGSDAITDSNIIELGINSGAATTPILLSGPASYADPFTYTVSTAPTASAHTGKQIYVSDGAAGAAILAFSDGSNWKRSDTGATISGS